MNFLWCILSLEWYTYFLFHVFCLMHCICLAKTFFGVVFDRIHIMNMCMNARVQVRLCKCVCVCVCVTERKREKEQLSVQFLKQNKENIFSLWLHCFHTRFIVSVVLNSSIMAQVHRSDTVWKMSASLNLLLSKGLSIESHVWSWNICNLDVKSETFQCLHLSIKDK